MLHEANVRITIIRHLLDPSLVIAIKNMKSRFDMRKCFLCVAFIFSGCSYKGVYENIQTSNRVECGKLPPSQYEECVRGNSKPYDEYERERR